MLSIEIVVTPAEVELASGLMWAAGVAGIEERDLPDGRVRLIAGVEPSRIDAVADELAERWEVERGEPDADAYMDAWRPYARAARLADEVVVQPPWIEPIARPGDVVISLDPGRAWGHGSHPSTMLAAEEVLRLRPLAGWTVLDIGCGSGLLAIVAARYGASRVVAVDVDPAAVEATLANALVNGVDDRIEVSATPVGLLSERFELIVANIGLAVLVEMSTVVTGLLAPGGALVLSGVLDEQVDAVVDAYPGLTVESRRDADGWAAVTLRAPA